MKNAEWSSCAIKLQVFANSLLSLFLLNFARYPITALSLHWLATVHYVYRHLYIACDIDKECSNRIFCIQEVLLIQSHYDSHKIYRIQYCTYLPLTFISEVLCSCACTYPCLTASKIDRQMISTNRCNYLTPTIYAVIPPQYALSVYIT